MNKKAQTKLNAWLKTLARREGKKHEASIGDIREIVGFIADDSWSAMNGAPAWDTLNMLAELGKSRAKKARNVVKGGKR